MRYLRTNTACRITVGPFFDKTDGVTPETALTVTSCKLTLMVDVANVPTLILDVAPTASGGANDMVHVTGDDAGFYDLELAAADVNYLGRAMLAITDAATHCPIFHEFMILPAMVYDSMVLGTDVMQADTTQWLGTAVSTPTVAGVPNVNTKTWNDLTTVALPLIPTVAGRTLDCSAGGEAGVDWANIGSPTTSNALTGTTIATTQKVDVETIKTNPVVNAGTITFPTTATLASTTNITAGTVTTATNVTTVNGLAANVITAASIAADAIGASELAADAVTEIRSLVSGTSDSGTTTTMVDAARTEADTDYWKGSIIVFTSGNISGQARLITGFDAATDTITYAPATTQAALAQTYEIWPNSAVDVQQWLQTTVSTPTVAGVPNVNTKTWNDLTTVALPLVPTTAGRTLDVSATGEGGIDWANVGSPTTTLALTGTTIATTQKVDIETIKTNPVVNAGTVTFPTTATLASTTNITAGTVTTATNLTNAPTAGDFTAVMKTSLNAATPSVTVSDKTGFSLSSAGIQAIWDALTSALTTVGSIGKLLVDNINATISSRMATYTQPTGFLAATFPTTVASTTNITGGTITTVTNLTNAPTSGDLTATMKTSVNAEVLDVLNTDTFAEPAQGTPGATISLAAKLGFLYKAWRNKTTQTATTYSLFNDDAATVDHKSTTSDDATTFTKTEITTGP